MITLDDNWQSIHLALDEAISVAWDGCHKIYLLLDEPQHDLMQSYGYDPLVRIDSVGTAMAYDMLRAWWDGSCSLRFVSAVRTVEGNEHEGFSNLIDQFEDDDEEEQGS